MTNGPINLRVDFKTVRNLKKKGRATSTYYIIAQSRNASGISPDRRKDSAAEDFTCHVRLKGVHCIRCGLRAEPYRDVRRIRIEAVCGAERLSCIVLVRWTV